MRNFGFGCMRLPLNDPANPADIDLPQVEKMVDAYMEAGFTYFDTLYFYHRYMSEPAIKQALVNRYPRESYVLADKLPSALIKEEGAQERIFADQFEKCGVDYFDYYLLHALGGQNSVNTDKYDSWNFLRQQRDAGKIKKLGFSYHYTPEYLDELLTRWPDAEFVQLQINYLDWEDGAIQARANYEVARKHGKPVFVMEPLKGGALVNLPAEAEARLREVAPDRSPAEWALRFCTSLPGVEMVLSGMSTLEQVQDNVSFMANPEPLTEAEIALLHEIAASIRENITVPCTGCNYCTVKCPKNICIPEYFSLLNAEKRTVSKDFSTQGMFYRSYIRDHGAAKDCIGCKACERSCPQHLPIVEYLQMVSKAFDR